MGLRLYCTLLHLLLGCLNPYWGQSMKYDIEPFCSFAVLFYFTTADIHASWLGW